MSTPLTLLDEEEQFFFDTVLRFARDEIAPHVRNMDESGSFDPNLIKRFFELGLMAVSVPESYGGQDGSFFMSVLAVQALSRVDASAGVIVDVQNTLVNNALLRWGSADQKQRYLPQMATSWVGSYALSEASSGSDAFGLKTRAVEDGNHYLLTGRKLWITNAAESELFLVFATVDPDAGHRGITGFLVERSFAGLSIGRKEDKLGIRASSTCEVVLDQCRVPRKNVLGEVGKGYKIAIETLNEGRIAIAAQMLGLAESALALAIAHVKQRTQFGQQVSEFQAVQHQIAQAATEIEASRLLVYNAARLKDAGKPFIKEAAMAKLFSSELAVRIAALSVDLHGGVGFTKDYPVEKLYRDAKIGTIYEGSSNMQLQTIARDIFG
jgi:short/branched chain acyl-CoA dehydrogenase